MKREPIDYRLYLVTEEATPIDHLLSIVEEAVDGGVTLVQLREKKSDGRMFFEKAQQLKAFLDTLSVPLIINDRVDIALAANAAGVHVGQSDLPLAAIKKIIPSSMVAGVSAHTVEEAVLAESQGADYIGTGAVFPTNSKHDAELLSKEMLQKIIDSVSIPVVAIGGITEENATHLQAFDIQGIAVVSSITRSADPRKAAQILMRKTFGMTIN